MATHSQAWQHIYSNVEKEQSPTGKGGFQTLFYTHAGLTPAEVEEMEARLLYFPGEETSPVKRLFFVTSTGKSVVSQIVPLAATDKYGRGGRYLAHSLVFSPDAAAQFQADPFCVFPNFSFAASVEEALALGDFSSGDIPPVSLALRPAATTSLNAARGWSAQALQKLTLLALQVDKQAAERNAVTVTGPPEQIESALAAAFFAVPVAMRPRCTFDTYFYRGNLVATWFWAIGLPEPPVSVKFAHVDASARQIQGHVDTQPTTSYERWVVHLITANKLAEIVKKRESAFALSEWLDGRQYNTSQLEIVSIELIKAVFEHSPQAVQSALARRVEDKLPAELVERATAQVFKIAAVDEQYRYLRHGFQLVELMEALLASYEAEKFAEPGRGEQKALEKSQTEAQHKKLRLVQSYWSNPKKELPKQLEQANEADYGWFVARALKWQLVKPLYLLVTGKGNAFLDVCLPAGVDFVPELADALVEVKETACLPRLNDLLSGLSRKDFGKLSDLAEKNDAVPKEFSDAVEQAIAALPPEEGIKGMIKSVWRRLPGQ